MSKEFISNFADKNNTSVKQATCVNLEVSQKLVNKTSNKDTQEFLSICRLCEAHPLSTGNSLTIGDWSIVWKQGESLVIKDIVKDITIVNFTKDSLVSYTTWYQVRLVLQNSDKDLKIIFERARQLQRLVTENKHYAPNADASVLRFIGNFLFHGVPEIPLETSCESVRSTFRAGYCYYFAIMLRAAFQRGRVCHAHPFSHIVWVDDNGVPYDVEGVYFGEADRFVPIECLDDIESFKHVGME